VLKIGEKKNGHVGRPRMVASGLLILLLGDVEDATPGYVTTGPLSLSS